MTYNAEQATEMHYQGYYNAYFLKLNLQKLTDEQLNEIIERYFVERDEDGSDENSDVKLSKEYKSIVLVKEPKNLND